MKILYAASEARPFIASGGLADVAGSLPKAVKGDNLECRVVLPLYEGIPQELRERMKYVKNFTVPLGWRLQYCGLFETEHGGVKYYFLDNEYYFKRSGIYGFFDDGERFAFFSKAIIELLLNIDYAPDIIHCNDWQTAMVPVFLNVFYRDIDKLRGVRTVFTIHNIQYQGKYGMDVATDICGLPDSAMPIVEYDKCLNMMKGAIEQSDMVTTVSPTYAEEILDPWYSFGLDRILGERRYKLYGILNGIDVDTYNPKTDVEIFKNYTWRSLDGKGENKAQLQESLGLTVDPDRPLIAIISRLVAMKGLDLVRYIFPEILEEGFQVAVLGTGDGVYEDFFLQQSREHSDTVSYTRGFLPPLSRKLYAGSDIFLMPSKSEPCGISQMIALRYGSIPVVRLTGGLKDTISDLGGDGGNGFTFATYNAHDMLGALRRAKSLYGDRSAWNKAVGACMRCDFSWQHSAEEYRKLYVMVMSNY